MTFVFCNSPINRKRQNAFNWGKKFPLFYLQVKFNSLIFVSTKTNKQ